MFARKTIRDIAAMLLLAGLCFFAFGGALRNGFVHFDDDVYVSDNPHVTQGLTLEGFRWAFTTGHASNWHPLTWLSHMLDVEVWGMAPAGYHLTSLLLHALNAFLLFVILQRMTGRFDLALLAAALWAVHPLRVESVVWISERKDVLAMFFGLLAVGIYGGNPRKTTGVSAPGDRKPRIAWISLVFALSLMAKPTWVPLPFLLLLLDGWPLRRWPGISAGKLVREKWPLFLLAALSCGITIWVQAAGGSVRSFEGYPLALRLANAVVAYGHYVWSLVWPTGLAFFYPYPEGGYPVAVLLGSVVLLALLTVLAGLARHRRPWWTTGWLWFLGSLVPMIGLVQVGGQAWADRYTYLPHIGLIVALVWGAVESAEAVQVRSLRKVWGVLAAGLVVGLVLLSRRQTRTWRDSEALFAHALDVTENNALAHGNLGSWYAREGRGEEAEYHLRRSLELQPGANDAHYNLGQLYLSQGKTAAAIRCYRMMLAESPRHVGALNNLAWLLATDPEATPEQAQEALALARRAVACMEEPGDDLLDTLEQAQTACQKVSRPGP